MSKLYIIKLDNVIIGHTELEKADPPMGVVFGRIYDENRNISYEFIKSYCQNNGIELADDYPEDKFISTRTIENLRIFTPSGVEIKGLGNQVSGMDDDEFEISIEGIDSSFYANEFPHHVKDYDETLMS